MPAKTELTDEEMDDIISALKESDDEEEAPMQVVRGGAVKQPSKVRVVDNEALPIDDATRRKTEKDAARKDDKLLKTLKGNTTDPRTLETVVEELAEEIFALKYERERLEAGGRDIANTAGRRVTAIKALIDTHLKLRELTRDEALDLNSDQMKVVMRLIFTKIQISLEEAGQPKQAIQAFFQVFQKNMDTFEIEARRLLDKEAK